MPLLQLLERALRACSASLLIQPAQLSIELNHQGQDSRQLFDRCMIVEPFIMFPVGSNTASVQCLGLGLAWLDTFSRQLTPQQRPQTQLDACTRHCSTQQKCTSWAFCHVCMTIYCAVQVLWGNLQA